MAVDITLLQDKVLRANAHHKKYKEWEEKFDHIMSKGTSKQLSLFALKTMAPLSLENTYLHMMLSLASLGGTTRAELEKIFQEMHESNVIKHYQFRDKGFNLVLSNDTPLRFIAGTDYFKGIEEYQPQLLTHERTEAPHETCMAVAKFLNLDYKVVSGFCSIHSKTKTFPHTWLEIEGKSHVWVFDVSINAMINKDAYYQIYHPRKTISIGWETFSKDYKLLRQTSFANRDARLYLYSPEEARKCMHQELFPISEQNTTLD